jgi:hypothetical protein
MRCSRAQLAQLRDAREPMLRRPVATATATPAATAIATGVAAVVATGDATTVCTPAARETRARRDASRVDGPTRRRHQARCARGRRAAGRSRLVCVPSRRTSASAAVRPPVALVCASAAPWPRPSAPRAVRVVRWADLRRPQGRERVLQQALPSVVVAVSIEAWATRRCCSRHKVLDDASSETSPAVGVSDASSSSATPATRRPGPAPAARDHPGCRAGDAVRVRRPRPTPASGWCGSPVPP